MPHNALPIGPASKLAAGNFRRAQFARVWVAGACVALLCALGAEDVASASAAPTLRAPRVQRVSLLYVLNARAGTLRPRAGHRRLFTLRLTQLEPHGLWLSDRPAPRSATFPSAHAASAWKGFGFKADPPSAALVYPRDPDGRGTTVIVELTRPRYSPGSHSLSFIARRTDPNAVTSPHLAAHAKAADPTPPRAFASPSLFIADATARVVNGCIIQPATQCNGADLAAADLNEASLIDAQLNHGNLVRARLRGADMSGIQARNAFLEGAQLALAKLDAANLSGADLSRADLRRADLSRSDLSRADLSRADLSGADLRRADLTGAKLNGANLTHADLTGANLTGATFDYATICGATLPDGSTGSCDGNVCSPLVNPGGCVPTLGTALRFSRTRRVLGTPVWSYQLSHWTRQLSRPAFFRVPLNV